MNKFTSRQVNQLLVDRVNEDKVTEEQRGQVNKFTSKQVTCYKG